MKFSKFNILQEENNELFIYNTLSGGILHLNPEYTENYVQMSKNSDLSLGKNDLLENLKKGQMLVEDTFNENGFVIMQSNIERFSNQAYTLTIAPTMKCNFVCPYCYEANKTYPQMDRNVIEKLKILFKQIRENFKFFSIAWYGGEPLLAFDIIKELSQEAIGLFGDNYCASIVTNGYLLNDEIIRDLERLKIQEMQITLDGPPEIHNKRRMLPSGEDTFFVILNNIKKVLESAPDVTISIRVNTDKENIVYVDNILTYLEEYGIKDRVGFYLAPVDNINETCNGSLCFNNTEFAKEQLHFVERNLKKGYNFLHLPRVNFGMCCAVSHDNYVIDAVGDIYKCWDDVAKVEQKIGNIMETKLATNENLTKWMTYDIRKDKECMECPYLPLCMGGCPNYQIKKNEKKCIPLKENTSDVIKVLYQVSRGDYNEA